MKLQDLFLSETLADEIVYLEKVLKHHRPLKLFVIAHKRGIGLIHTIEQQIPGIKRIELHDHATPLELVKSLKQNEGHPILFDALSAQRLQPEQIHVIKAAINGGSAYARTMDDKIEADVNENVIVALSSNINPHEFGASLDRVFVYHIGKNS